MTVRPTARATMHEQTVYDALDRRATATRALGVRHRLRRPARRASTRPCPTASTAPTLGDVLPDARRRRAGRSPAALRVVSRAPDLEEDIALANIALDLLGQARLLLARAGRSADPRSSRRCPTASDAPRGRAGVLPRRRRSSATLRLVERADGDFAARPSCGCSSSRPWRLALLRPAARLAATRCWPRSPPRASRSWPTTATTPPAGCCASATGRRSRAAARRTALDAVWPLIAELFAPTDVERRLAAAGVAVDPARLRDEVRRACSTEVLDRGRR